VTTVRFSLFAALRLCARRVFLFAGLTLAVAASADPGALPPLQHSGDIGYISGGIGLEESQAIRAEAAHHALSIIFTSRIDQRDSYTAPEQVTIFKADGAPVLDLKPDGPFLLIDLPPGKYRISAGSAQWSRTQMVKIGGGGHQQLVFQLPEAGAE